MLCWFDGWEFTTVLLLSHDTLIFLPMCSKCDLMHDFRFL